MKQPIETQALIIGAGPAGSFAVFELGLLGISAQLVDALPYAGGQCIELYPDKPIYDIPGTPATTGRRLVASLLRQIKPFNTPMHLGQQVSSLQRQDVRHNARPSDAHFMVGTTQGQTFIAKTIFIAAGVGAFLPKKLSVAGLEAFDGTQIFYHVNQLPQLPNSTSRRITIVGSEDTAVQAAIDLCQHHTVTLLHRRDVFKAAPAALEAMRTRLASGQLQLRIGQITGFETDTDTPNAKLSTLEITGADGITTPLPTDTLLVLQGLSPKLGPVAEWGLDIDRKQLQVDTEKFQTSEAGIFAVGDINTYPGKKKLIVSGFHEATLAAFAAAAIIFPHTPSQLLYTSTSTLLLQRLGKNT